VRIRRRDSAKSNIPASLASSDSGVSGMALTLTGPRERSARGGHDERRPECRRARLDAAGFVLDHGLDWVLGVLWHSQRIARSFRCVRRAKPSTTQTRPPTIRRILASNPRGRAAAWPDQSICVASRSGPGHA
jgi:hypothetical protein